MSEKNYRKIRCKNRFGLSCRWTIGPAPDGGFKIVGLGAAKLRGQAVPLDFIPFELSNEVYNGPILETLDAVERHVRSL